MKNYAHKTNKTVTRYRTPATFRVRAVMATQKTKSNRQAPPYFGQVNGDRGNKGSLVK